MLPKIHTGWRGEQALAYLRAHPNTALTDWVSGWPATRPACSAVPEGLEQIRVEVQPPTSAASRRRRCSRHAYPA
jgi:hypothetical protein